MPFRIKRKVTILVPVVMKNQKVIGVRENKIDYLQRLVAPVKIQKKMKVL